MAIYVAMHVEYSTLRLKSKVLIIATCNMNVLSHMSGFLYVIRS